MELLWVEEAFWALVKKTGVPIYDFEFARLLACRHPYQRPPNVSAVARIGAFEDYAAEYARLSDDGITLVNSPEQHLRASGLPHWYGIIEDLTPRSAWFDHPPQAPEVSARFNWPIFLKGERQTSRHQRGLSIIDGPDAFNAAMDIYRQDPILQWQRIVCREF